MFVRLKGSDLNFLILLINSLSLIIYLPTLILS